MGIDTVVKCDVCGKTLSMKFQGGLANGWPECHGYTMRLFKYPKPAEIGKATKNVLGKR